MGKFLIITHLYATFNGHKPFVSRDIRCLIFYVTLQDHVIIGLCDFMEESYSSYIPTPATFRSHRHCYREYRMILVCHVISQDEVIKGSCDFMDCSPSRKGTILPSLVAIGSQVVKICF